MYRPVSQLKYLDNDLHMHLPDSSTDDDEKNQEFQGIVDKYIQEVRAPTFGNQLPPFSPDPVIHWKFQKPETQEYDIPCVPAVPISTTA